MDDHAHPLYLSALLDRAKDARSRAEYHRARERQHCDAAEHWERLAEQRQQDATRAAGVVDGG